MLNKFFIILILLSSIVLSKNQFMGIIEDGSVNKNNFLCPLSLNASGNVVCNNMDAEMIGFDISGGHSIQIFNNQQYWLQQKFERQHLLMVQGYQGDRLSSTMTNEGWDHMGAFSIVVSADPIVVEAIESDKVAAKGETKLIVQLWYSGATGLQLWAQDVQSLKSGQNFKILISNASSNAFANSSSVNPNPLPTSKSSKSSDSSDTISSSSATSSQSFTDDVVTASKTSFSVTTKAEKAIPTTLQNFKQQLLEQVGFAPSYIQKDVYNAAYGSPRNIQIQVQ